MAKGRKTGGRMAGTPNKSTVPAHQMAERLGVDPLEVLFMVVKGDWKGLGYTKPTKTKHSQFGVPFEVELIPLELRIHAAQETSQYLHPKKKAVELSGNLDLRLQQELESLMGLSEEELKKLLVEALKK